MSKLESPASLPKRLSSLNYGIVRTVKKILLILLMVLLPVQFAWSAAAVYCQHEKGGSLHFGHHTHEHKDKAEQKIGDSKLTKADNDCEYCHLFYHPYLTNEVLRLAPSENVDHAALTHTSYSSHIPNRPPKPNWQLVA